MSGLNNMRQRLMIAGGNQDGRNVKGKVESMRFALWNSYQGEWITFDNKRWRCLINPDKLSEDYEQKEISIEFTSGMRPGDVFYWNRTNQYWITYSQREDEEAYYRARVRKCEYQVSTDTADYWVWVGGPSVKDTDWEQKSSWDYNNLNYTLKLYITRNEDTLDFFSRHQELKFDNHNWKVVAANKYSESGIIIAYLKESYDNSMEDAMIVPEIIKPDTSSGVPYIDGLQEISVGPDEWTYLIKNAEGGTFSIDSKAVEILDSTENYCTIKVLTMRNKIFTIDYKNSAGASLANLEVEIKK